MTTCNICCEKFNKTLNLKITCQCGFEACKTCIRTYILSTTKDPHCMECKIQWSNKFLVDNLNRSYIDGEFKKYRKNLLVDRQISKTSELMPLVERTRIIEDKNIELDKLNEQYKEAKKIFNNISDLLYKKKFEITQIKNGNIEVERKKFIMPCPHTNCKGYLSTQYKCEVCKLYTCPHCHEVIGHNKDDPHTCIQSNLESAELIKKETKGCPQCGVRIFKISGCDQMWCTECKVAFSWKTGRIIYSGQIHNPHYYDYLKNNQTNFGNAPRNPGDILCGGLIDFYSLNSLCRYIDSYKDVKWFNTLKTDTIISKFIKKFNFSEIYNFASILTDLHRTVNHITNVNLYQSRNKVRTLENNDDITVQYILNKITKDKLATNILKNDISRKKYSELLNIYELLSVVGIEKFNNLNNNFINLKNQKTYYSLTINNIIYILHSIIDLIDQYNNLINYTNEQMIVIGKTYNQSVSLIRISMNITTHTNTSISNANRRRHQYYQILTGKFTDNDLKKINDELKKINNIQITGNNNHEASSSSDN